MRNLKEILLSLNWSKDQIKDFGNIRTYFFSINLLKTLYVNFKLLPFKQAVRLPILIAYNTKLHSLGKIKITCDKVWPGMVSIGVVKIENWESNQSQTIISNYGSWEFGGRCKIHPGAKICVHRNALLSFGRYVSIGCCTRLVAFKQIKLGNNVRVSWDSQVFDTDFHFLEKVATGKIYDRVKPISIEDDVFIGNNCTIGKGTQVPAGSVISCCSKVIGDFTNEGENLLILGNPAKVVSKGFKMGSSWFPERELMIAKSKGEL